MQNIKKNIKILVFLYFSITLDQICPKFVPDTTSTLLFLAGIQWNMLGDSININDLCCNPVVLKKFGKSS